MHFTSRRGGHCSTYHNSLVIMPPVLPRQHSYLFHTTPRSKSNTTIYHRILKFCLSVADFVASFVIALTTLPMPKNVMYPFARPSYGTRIGTREAQGLAYFIVVGTSTSIVLSLCFISILGIY